MVLGAPLSSRLAGTSANKVGAGFDRRSRFLSSRRRTEG